MNSGRQLVNAIKLFSAAAIGSVAGGGEGRPIDPPRRGWPHWLAQLPGGSARTKLRPRKRGRTGHHRPPRSFLRSGGWELKVGPTEPETGNARTSSGLAAGGLCTDAGSSRLSAVPLVTGRSFTEMKGFEGERDAAPVLKVMIGEGDFCN